MENRTSESVVLWCRFGNCSQIDPRQRRRLGFPFPQSAQFGFLVHTPVAAAPHLTLSNRIFERTLRAQPRGVEIPVVREGSFFSGDRTFLGVPAGEGVRVSLRAYDPWVHLPTPTTNLVLIRVSVQTLAGDELGSFELRPQILNPEGPAVDYYKPGIAMVHDLAAVVPAVAAHERVHIRVSAQPAQAQYYGMVAVTDNETQTVSIISAQ